MDKIEQLKKFVFDAILLKDSLASLEEKGISVRGQEQLQPLTLIEESEFSPINTYNANKMASVYVALFCLENSVRDLISERLLERHGIGWWEQCIPNGIKKNVEKLRDKEETHRYHSRRSSELIGYTMLGELSQIIISNWEDFSDILPNQTWVTSRFNDLEMSRNIIMHTGVLPEIEIERIESIARDWIRQVG